jgi:hypothetical protein
MLLGQRGRVSLVVTHQNERDLPLPDVLPELRTHPIPERPVQGGKGLIQQKNPGMAKKGPAQCHPLLLTP